MQASRKNSLTLILTEQCNFNCSYCPQPAGIASMSPAIMRAALERILPLLDRKTRPTINFYGGEPLLCRDLLLQAMELALRISPAHHPRFSLSTNGSLLDQALLAELAAFDCRLIISHDGLWQTRTRPQSQADQNLEHFETLLAEFPGLDCVYSCVCPAEEVGRLAENVRYFAAGSKRPVWYAPDLVSPWSGRQSAELKNQLEIISVAGLAGHCPAFFRAARPAEFVCPGAGRLSVDPAGAIWRCHLFPGLFRRHPAAGRPELFQLGRVSLPQNELRDLLAGGRPGPLLEQRQWLAGERACLTCELYLYCHPCPVNGAYASGRLGRLPDWTCSVQRVLAGRRL